MVGALNRREVLPILWLLAIGILAVIPVPKGEGVPAILNVGHVGVYTILTLLWGWALKANNRTIAASVVCIPLTELLQLFTPWREANILDIANNTLGVMVGLLVFLFIVKVIRTR